MNIVLKQEFSTYFKNIPTKGGYIFVIAVIITVLIGGGRDALARFAWRHNQPLIAYWLANKDAKTANDIGNYYFESAHYEPDKARGLFLKALSQDPGTLGPRYQLARISFLNNRMEEARNYIDQEIAAHPDFIRSYYIRGLINGYSRHFSSAVDDFKTFLQWKPESWAAHNDLAWVYTQMRDFTSAVDTARLGLKYNPRNPWLETTLGVSLLNLKEYQEAEQELSLALEDALKLTPEDWGKAYPGNDPKTYEQGLLEMKAVLNMNLAIAEKNLGKKPAARSRYQTFLRLASPQNPYREFVLNELNSPL